MFNIKMRPVLALLLITFFAFHSAAANCYDDFVTNNPEATELDQSNMADVPGDPCCDGVGVTIPDSLTDLSTLTKLHIFCDNLGGTLPRGLGDLSNLKQLSLACDNNILSGPIPDASKFTQISEFGLWNCQRTGTLPQDLSNLLVLSYLNLAGNLLTGTLNESLAQLTDLEYLLVMDNQFSGGIPSVLGTMQAIQKMFLHNNMLTGTIPTELTDLANLWEISLYGNRFHGGLPSFGESDSHLSDFVSENGGNEQKYDYLAPGDDCSGDNKDQCSLAADACDLSSFTCCSPGEECSPGVMNTGSAVGVLAVIGVAMMLMN